MLLLTPLLLGWGPAKSKAGVVATAHPHGTRAGVEMLRAGGNAIDAAVAAAYALSVVEQYSAGIGGGGFLLYREAKTGKVYVLDYREVAPKRATRDMYLVAGKVDPVLSVDGILGVGVPGMVPGLDAAQKRFGKKTLAESLDVAISLAVDGFEVLPAFEEGSEGRLKSLKKNAEASRVLLKDGRPYRAGERLVQKDLAKTLKLLKQEGSRLFTHGAIARAIAAESKRLGGILELSDLEAFEPRWRRPLRGSYRGYEIVTMPPPSSGGLHLLQILALIERDRQTRGRKNHWLDADDLHMLAESMRVAYADRSEHLGDPKFWDVPIGKLLDPTYVNRRYEAIDVAKSKGREHVQPAKFRDGPAETTHITVMDAEGNVVTLTQTVNYGWGSGVIVPGTGILLNNEMDDFAAAPGAPNVYGLVGGEANSVQPGKIPLSSMTPTIVLKNGEVKLACGSPGGSRIITTVLQLILQVVDYGLPIEDAIASARIHHQWLPEKLRIEPQALTPEIEKALEAKGHVLDRREHYWSDATAIEVLADGTRVAVADPRADGDAAAQ